jgi:hypothetical protein
MQIQGKIFLVCFLKCCILFKVGYETSAVKTSSGPYYFLTQIKECSKVTAAKLSRSQVLRDTFFHFSFVCYYTLISGEGTKSKGTRINIFFSDANSDFIHGNTASSRTFIFCISSHTGVRLTTHIHVLARLRMMCAVPPLPLIHFHDMYRDKYISITFRINQ